MRDDSTDGKERREDQRIERPYARDGDGAAVGHHVHLDQDPAGRAFAGGDPRPAFRHRLPCAVAHPSEAPAHFGLARGVPVRRRGHLRRDPLVHAGEHRAHAHDRLQRERHRRDIASVHGPHQLVRAEKGRFGGALPRRIRPGHRRHRAYQLLGRDRRAEHGRRRPVARPARMRPGGAQRDRMRCSRSAPRWAATIPSR